MSASLYYNADAATAATAANTTSTKGSAGQEEISCRYEYHHGSGKHILVQNNGERARHGYGNHDDLNRPNYSFHCFFCNCIDILIFAGCIAFLFFAIRYALYQLENNDGGD